MNIPQDNPGQAQVREHDAEQVTVRRLTPSNVDALRRIMRDYEAERVTLGVTVAMFHMPTADALRLVERLHARARAEHGGRGHPARSLPAVYRKLRKLAGDQ